MYKKREVNGVRFDADKLRLCKILVQVSDDDMGKTLSLMNGETMLSISLETVQDMIDITL